MARRGSVGRALRPEWGLQAASGFVVCLIRAAAAFAAVAGPASAAQDAPRPFRLAFSASMFTEVNESDARAAMKIWIKTVADEHGIPIDPDPPIRSTVEELLRLHRDHPVDGFALTTPEFVRLRQELEIDRFATGVTAGTISEEYVLLVRYDSGWDRLEQLQGRRLNVLLNPRMSLATLWLDTVLLEARRQPTVEFFGRVTTFNKASRVVLPVFFRQVDACLMTSKAFKLIGELNPQLARQLRILASSPEVVPSGFAYRADFVSPFRAQLLSEMTRLAATPAGRQILVLTQAERIQDNPVSCLDSTLEMLARHARLVAEKTAPTGRVQTPTRTVNGKEKP